MAVRRITAALDTDRHPGTPGRRSAGVHLYRLGAPVAAAALALAAGCGGAADRGDPSSAPTTSVSAPPDPVTGAAASPDVVLDASTVARAEGEVAVYDEPGASEPASVLPPTTEFGSPRALLVVADHGDWLQVSLPVRPNGATGWVRRDGLELRTIDEAIVVDTAARTLTLLDAGEPVLTTPVAVGTPDNSTPTGAYFVVDKLDTGDASGPYGRFAFGLSAHSDTLTEFAGGDGQVGIHGTDDPSSIGHAVSHGCIRVPADVAQRLADTVNLGTPVVVS
jgi:lipoprotein-anchoring transpeptidase ErfK/SrfK